MKLILATRNEGKIAELERLFASLPLTIETLHQHPEAPEVEEIGATYEANALAKARAVAQACGLPALADDSGLEVDALGGAPGVHSARYSGGDAAENVALLLRQLEGVPRARRGARFRCVLALVWPDGRSMTAAGVCEGEITEEARGAAGFGYDPVFLDPASGLTFAELGAEKKEAISHRTRACEALRRQLSQRA